MLLPSNFLESVIDRSNSKKNITRLMKQTNVSPRNFLCLVSVSMRLSLLAVQNIERTKNKTKFKANRLLYIYHLFSRSQFPLESPLPISSTIVYISFTQGKNTIAQIEIPATVRYSLYFL